MSLRMIYVAKVDLDRTLDRVTREQTVLQLARRDYRVRAIAGYATEKVTLPAAAQADLIRLPLDPIWRSLVFYFRLYFMLQAAILRREVDVVILDKHTFFCCFPFDVLAKLKLSKLKVMVDFRDNLTTRSRSRLRNLLARGINFLGPLYSTALAGGITASTDVTFEEFARIAGKRHSRTCALPSAVDVDLFDPDRVSPPPIPGVRAGDFLFVYHGSMGHNRGLLELLDAFARLQTLERCKLLLLGSGPLQPLLRSKIEVMGLSNVILLDRVPQAQVPAYLSACQAGVLPYPDDPMWRMSSPLKVLEYLAMNKAVILRNFPVYQEITAGLDGVFYLEDNDPETIAALLENVYQQSETLAQRAAGGRTRVQERFTWEQVGRQLDAFIQSL